MSITPIGIVGGGLGGLSAAIHLRARGFPVCIFEKNSRVGGRANLLERNGYRFDTGPSLLNYPWIFEQLFSLGGKSLHKTLDLLPVDPALVFRWPDDSELRLSSDLTELRASFARLEPQCDAGLMSFLADGYIKYRLAFEKLVSRNADHLWDWLRSLRVAEMRYVTVWRSLYSELGRFFRSRQIKEALGAYAMYLGGSPFDLPGFFSILPFGELAYGLWLPRGGMYALIQAVEQLAKDMGVTLYTHTPVSEICVEGGRVRGIRTVSGEFFDFPFVISNVDLPFTDRELLPKCKELQRRKDAVSRIRMTPGVCTFYWGVRKKIERLGHHTVFLPEQYRRTFYELDHQGKIPEEIPFYTSVASATDPTLAPEGKSTVFILVPTPCLSRLGHVDWEEIRRRLRNQIFERLHRHDIALTPEDIETEDFYSPADWSRIFSLFDGSAFGAAHTLRQIGPFRSPNFSKEIHGLYYTGASTIPGTGLPMVVLSGKLTAERIIHHVC